MAAPLLLWNKVFSIAAMSLWNTLPKNIAMMIVSLFVNFQISMLYLLISIKCRRIDSDRVQYAIDVEVFETT